MVRPLSSPNLSVTDPMTDKQTDVLNSMKFVVDVLDMQFYVKFESCFIPYLKTLLQKVYRSS